jgi:hypothetical protein
MHKRAFGVAVGLWAALLVFSLTAVALLRPSVAGPDLALLSQYFTGYTVSWGGSIIGAFWAGVTGFTMGWFFALVRNLWLSLYLFLVRSRSELDQSRDFLDHI